MSFTKMELWNGKRNQNGTNAVSVKKQSNNMDEEDIRDQIDDLQMTSTLEQYTKEFLQLVNMIPILSEEIKIHLYRRNLTPVLSAEIRYRKPATLQEACHIAYERNNSCHMNTVQIKDLSLNTSSNTNFCTNCKKAGHSIQNCFKINNKKPNQSFVSHDRDNNSYKNNQSNKTNNVMESRFTSSQKLSTYKTPEKQVANKNRENIMNRRFRQHYTRVYFPDENNNDKIKTNIILTERRTNKITSATEVQDKIVMAHEKLYKDEKHANINDSSQLSCISKEKVIDQRARQNQADKINTESEITKLESDMAKLDKNNIKIIDRRAKRPNVPYYIRDSDESNDKLLPDDGKDDIKANTLITKLESNESKLNMVNSWQTTNKVIDRRARRPNFNRNEYENIPIYIPQPGDPKDPLEPEVLEDDIETESNMVNTGTNNDTQTIVNHSIEISYNERTISTMEDGLGTNKSNNELTLNTNDNSAVNETNARLKETDKHQTNNEKEQADLIKHNTVTDQTEVITYGTNDINKQIEIKSSVNETLPTQIPAEFIHYKDVISNDSIIDTKLLANFQEKSIIHKNDQSKTLLLKSDKLLMLQSSNNVFVYDRLIQAIIKEIIKYKNNFQNIAINQNYNYMKNFNQIRQTLELCKSNSKLFQEFLKICWVLYQFISLVKFLKELASIQENKAVNVKAMEMNNNNLNDVKDNTKDIPSQTKITHSVVKYQPKRIGELEIKRKPQSGQVRYIRVKMINFKWNISIISNDYLTVLNQLRAIKAFKLNINNYVDYMQSDKTNNKYKSQNFIKILTTKSHQTRRKWRYIQYSIYFKSLRKRKYHKEYGKVLLNKLIKVKQKLKNRIKVNSEHDTDYLRSNFKEKYQLQNILTRFLLSVSVKELNESSHQYSKQLIVVLQMNEMAKLDFKSNNFKNGSIYTDFNFLYMGY